MTDRACSRGAIVVISGPSGTGKTTLLKRLLAGDGELVWSVSATTRSPRPDEVDGRDYIFLTREAFEKDIAAGAFAEYAESFGQLYGTPAGPLQEALDSGRVILLDIDVQGAMQIREKFPDAWLVMICPPSMDVLAERLKKRHTETAEQSAARLARARAEANTASRYDDLIVNDDLETALAQLQDVIRKAKETGRG
jgi:guanylate kinase